MRDLASIPASRRLFKRVDCTEAERAALNSAAHAARDATFLADPLCIQSSSTCSTCGAARKYAPKGKFQTPGQYADEATHECRRGVGADSCGRAEAAGGNPLVKKWCNPEAIATALQRRTLPFIQFFPAGRTPLVTDPSKTLPVVAAVAALTPPRLKATVAGKRGFRGLEEDFFRSQVTCSGGSVKDIFDIPTCYQLSYGLS